MRTATPVTAGSVTFANERPLALIAGPCQLESRAHALEMSAAIKEVADKFKINVIYKSSFDKANRSSIKSARGVVAPMPEDVARKSLTPRKALRKTW